MTENSDNGNVLRNNKKMYWFVTFVLNEWHLKEFLKLEYTIKKLKTLTWKLRFKLGLKAKPALPSWTPNELSHACRAQPEAYIFNWRLKRPIFEDFLFVF